MGRIPAAGWLVCMSARWADVARIGAFNFSHYTIPLLLKSAHLPHPATLIFTGATASLRGSAECSSFASGKFALRALAQSLAREFGPKRVHVAHLIVDGGIDGPRMRQAKGGDTGDRLISPEGVGCSASGRVVLWYEWLICVVGQIADAYWNLHVQPPSAFTFELDIRPFAEKW
jgi:NAD(P)-dependent dehydrogenase (short-subunit alcohol dehydrogenase family)